MARFFWAQKKKDDIPDVKKKHVHPRNPKIKYIHQKVMNFTRKIIFKTLGFEKTKRREGSYVLKLWEAKNKV